MAEVNERDMLEGIGGLGILVHQLAKLAGREMLTPTHAPLDNYAMELELRLMKLSEVKTTQFESAIVAREDGYDVGLYNGMELAVSIMEDREPNYITSECLLEGGGEEPELPPGGTVLNPVEREALEKTLNEARESVQELYAIISPLKDLGFEKLNKMGKSYSVINTEACQKLGEVIDRANEYFHGR